MAKPITIEAWIHAITVMARTHGWFVQEQNARAHAPTHILLRDGWMWVIFARPSGGKLMAQHEEPMKRWQEVQDAALGDDQPILVTIERPDSAASLWAVLQDGWATGS